MRRCRLIGPSLRHLLSAGVAGLLQATAAFATNPLIMDQFTADPTARVFEGKIYVYPSHDIKAPPQYTGRPNWFVMEDYHVFSSSAIATPILNPPLFAIAG